MVTVDKDYNMNKCYYYLSSGLWEVVKLYYENNSKLQNAYFWGMAVTPNNTCFASHILSTPWQQSWATLKLLEHCHRTVNGEICRSELFDPDVIEIVKKEVNFQYTLRNQAYDEYVQGLFHEYRSNPSFGNRCDSEDWPISLQKFLSNLLQSCPSTAHCFTRQLLAYFPRLTELLSSDPLKLLLISTVADPLPLPKILSLTSSSYRKELFLLLLANGHSSVLRRIESEENQQLIDASLHQVQDFNFLALKPSQLFQWMLLTSRHFVLYLLDLLEMSPALHQTDQVPKFLWPSLLLRLWGKPDIADYRIQSLLYLCKLSTGDQAILRVCFMLEWYLSFSRWSASQGSERIVGLEAARDHSVLRLIHTSANLAQTDWTQVRALLHEPWDLLLLNGFCAHVLLLRAMMAAAAMKQERVRLLDAKEREERLIAEYQIEVTHRLQEIQELVQGIRPLTLRLEVLENLFAIIFVTWEDVQGVHFRRCSVNEPRSPGPSWPNTVGRGFICGPHVLRDTVLLIKKCTSELEREPKTEPELNVPCSIKPSQLENRLDRLTESLSEATWRLQLVTSPEFLLDVGSLSYLSERLNFEPEWLVESWPEQGKNKRRPCQEKREESGSQSPPSGGESDRGAERTPGPAFMNQMLASDWSLVVRCLSQGDLLNAEHIIAMMSSEESRQVLEGELNFTQAMTDLRRKVMSLVEAACRADSQIPTKSSGFKAVQQVAAHGVCATALSNHVERFLSCTTLPTIQGSSKVSMGSMLQCIENSAATVTLDLAITASTSFHDFRDLVSLAGKHCPELSTRLQSPLTGVAWNKPLGFIALAQTLLALLHEINKETAMSPATFLRSRHLSFSLKTLKDQEALWKQLRVLEQDVAKNGGGKENGGKDTGKGQKNIRNMQKILENVSKISENSAEVLDFGRSEVVASDLTRNVNYAELLNRYLSDLAALSLDFIAYKADGDDLVTFNALLELSAVEVLDRLVFTHHVDPALLEKKAQQLGFNLCASLLWGCCPPIPQGNALPLSQMPPPSGCTVLNMPEEGYSCESFENPVMAVSTILSGLLNALKMTAQCPSHIPWTVIVSSEYDKSVAAELARTQVLAAMDVRTIESAHIFQFYINLCNLMTLHCLISSMVREAFCSNENLVRAANFTFSGYHLGGQGFVSVADLRHALCGKEISRPFSLKSSIVLLNEVQPDSRAAFLLPALELFDPRPKLVIASSEPSTVQMKSAIDKFVKKHVFHEGSKLRIPAFLGWYIDAALMPEEANGSSDGSSDYQRRRFQTLLGFLKENCLGMELQSSIKNWSQSDLSLKVDVNSAPFALILDDCEHEHEQGHSIAIPIPVSVSQRWESRPLTEPVLKHISQSSRLLADLVARLHEGRSDTAVHGTEMGHDVLLDERLRCLEALLSAPWVQSLAPICDNNAALAALHKTPPTSLLWAYLNRCVKEKQWKECWTVLKALPDFCLQSEVNLRRTRDLVLFELATVLSPSDEAGWLYAQLISDLHLRTACIKTNYKFWPGSVAIKQWSAILRDEADLLLEMRSEVEGALRNIAIFSAIAERCSDFEGKSWLEVCTMSKTTPNYVLQVLLSSHLLELCLDWVSLPGVMESIVPNIDVALVIQFASLLPRQLKCIFSRIPSDHVLLLCEKAIPDVSSLVALRSVTGLCIEVSRDEDEIIKFRNMRLGVDLLRALEEPEEQKHLVHLVTKPLLILEQLVMNTRLSSVAALLKRLTQLPDRDLMPDKLVNDMLTRYASRAVQLDVVKMVQPATKENFFVAPAASDFIVPLKVPPKSQWVPDNQVGVCMCCRLVSFSMFNRRHHCRRCGRVVCATCSPHRIKVQGYEDVTVRVCHTCYSQHSKPEGQSKERTDPVVEVSVKEGIYYWSLTTNPSRNAMIREEFAYEHAPNSSLCLAIFNLLPASTTYTSLLLDESEKLLEVLQSRDIIENPEVDYNVLIKIIRSLVVGAKVRYGKEGLATGVVSCDRLLSQVDTISLLVRNHCTRLIPSEPLNDQTMRALRDRLVEEELWDLALELSTKAGLSLLGVWAAWGKVLLTAGCWVEARNKFAQCLVPRRNSPLLEEICRIIDNTSSSSQTNCTSAQEVLEILSNLKGLAGGKPPVRCVRGPGSLQHSEQEWYLTRYGNTSALLRFYLRHEQFNAALSVLVQRQLDPDVFIECILLPACKACAQKHLETEMLAMDPSLETFKRYLVAACVYFQKSQSFYLLHEIQVFMQDYVRAAMTCIHLYQSRGYSYTRLLEASDLLQSSLHHLEEDIGASTKKMRRLNHVMQLDQRDVHRHMNTIWRQLEVTKFLAACEAGGQPISVILVDLSWDEKLVTTLFDGQHARGIVAALCVLAGKNVEEAFGLSFRIIQDYNLDLVKVFTQVGAILGKKDRGSDLQQLAHCIRTSGAENSVAVSDQVLISAITAMAAEEHISNADPLVHLIANVDIKVVALTNLRQLKNAYLMAVKHNRVSLIERIMEEADRSGQSVIREICRKKLGLSSETSSICSSTPSGDTS